MFQSMFWIKKITQMGIPLWTTLYKLGIRGYILNGHVILMYHHCLVLPFALICTYLVHNIYSVFVFAKRVFFYDEEMIVMILRRYFMTNLKHCTRLQKMQCIF